MILNPEFFQFLFLLLLLPDQVVHDMGRLLLSFDLRPSEMYLVLLLYEETLPVYEFVLAGTTEQEGVLLAGTQHVRNYHLAQ